MALNLDHHALPRAPELIQVEVGLLQNFCEILYCPDTKEAALVDPAFEVDRLLRLAAEKDLVVKSILITHTHHDHIDGLKPAVAATGALTYVHPHERARVADRAGDIKELFDRQDIKIGNRGVRALECFGHTAGGVVFLADGYLIAGDVLFVGGCGRTDLPGGDTRKLWASLNRLMALPEETRVYPGHNYGKTPTSTLEREILENPFLRCANEEAFVTMRERTRRA